MMGIVKSIVSICQGMEFSAEVFSHQGPLGEGIVIENDNGSSYSGIPYAQSENIIYTGRGRR